MHREFSLTGHPSYMIASVASVLPTRTTEKKNHIISILSVATEKRCDSVVWRNTPTQVYEMLKQEKIVSVQHSWKWSSRILKWKYCKFENFTFIAVYSVWEKREKNSKVNLAQWDPIHTWMGFTYPFQAAWSSKKFWIFFCSSNRADLSVFGTFLLHRNEKKRAMRVFLCTILCSN